MAGNQPVLWNSHGQQQWDTLVLIWCSFYTFSMAVVSTSSLYRQIWYLDKDLHQSKQTPNLCCMPSVLCHHTVCVCAWVDGAWMYISSAVTFSPKPAAPPDPVLKTPFVLNALFCPSPLLASAGAHQVVIFYKVCIDTLQIRGHSNVDQCPEDKPQARPQNISVHLVGIATNNVNSWKSFLSIPFYIFFFFFGIFITL